MLQILVLNKQQLPCIARGDIKLTIDYTFDCWYRQRQLSTSGSVDRHAKPWSGTWRRSHFQDGVTTPECPAGRQPFNPDRWPLSGGRAAKISNQFPSVLVGFEHVLSPTLALERG